MSRYPWPVPRIECKACGHEVDAVPAERYICPACGANEGLHVVIPLTDSGQGYEFLSTKGRKEKGRQVLVAKSGDSYFHEGCEWHEIIQVADRRERRRYRKKVVRKSTGEVLRDEDVPLEEHEPTAVKRRREQEGQQA